MSVMEWMFSVDAPILVDNERIVIECSVNRVHTHGVQPGQLTLTTKRIIFKAFRLRFMPEFLTWRNLDLQLMDVRATSQNPTGSRRHWLIVPRSPVVVVDLNDGRKVSFQTQQAQEIQHEIDDALVSANGDQQ